MKKLYRPLCFVAAVAAMSLTSCQKENFNPAGEGETVTITVHANVEDVANATKTHIEGTQVLWDENEEMKIILFGDSAKSITAFSSDSFVPDEGNATGTFTVKVNTTTHTKMVGIYPNTAAGWIDSETTAPIILPDKQNASAGSYDPNAYVMITASEDLQEGDFEWNARYKRIAALNKFTLAGLAEGIKKVTITFPEGQPAAGTRNFDLTTGKAGSMSEGSSNAITVNYSTPLSAGTNDIWFTSWGVQMNEGEILTIRAETADKAYTKEFLAKQSGDIILENYLNEGTFDMSDATTEDIEPSPTEDFSGEYLIIAEGEKMWVCMSNNNTNDYFTSVESTTETTTSFDALTAADFHKVPYIESCVWTIQKTESGYTIKSREKQESEIFIELRNSTSNKAYVSPNPYTLTINKDNGIIKIQNPENAINGDSTGEFRWLQYNAGSPRFANYKEGQKDIYLLKWEDSTEPMLIVSEATKTVPADAESISFNYIARNLTGDVTAVIAEDKNDIINEVTVDTESETVNVTLVPNTDDFGKTATISISANTAGIEDQTLTIIQQAYAPLANVVLTFPDDNKDNNKCSAYTKTWTAINGSYEFNIENFNNNNWNNWTYIRCGSKNDASVGTISNVTSMPKIASIAVTVDKITTTEVNSIFLSIYSDEGLATQIGSNIAPNEGITSGTLTFNIPAEYQVSNQYYELSFDCQQGKSNGIIQISKVEYVVTE